MSKTETKTVDRVLESLAKIRDLKVNSKKIENAVKQGSVKASADGKWVPREPEALADGDVLLHIDGEIYPGVAAQFREKYELIDPQSHLVVKINSPGGSVEEMAEMYAIIAQHPGQTTGYVIGQASSAASALLQGFDTRVMDPLSVQMIHEVSPHERDVRAFLERVIFANDMLVDIYVSRNTADLTEERVREMFRDGDKRYKPAEAVELGFADMVALPREAEQEAEAEEPVATGWTMSSESDINQMLDYIAEGVAAICAKATKPNTAADSRDGSIQDSDSADETETTIGATVLDAFLKANGLTDDQIAALTDAQRAAFQKTFDGEKVEIQDKQPAGNDGATEMGGKLASDLDAVFIERTKLHAKINAELGEWPELVEKAISDSWDEKDIRIAKLEQERTTSTAGSGAGFSAITSDGSEKDLDQEKVVLCAFESSIGVDYKSLSDPWGDLNAEQRRQLGSELTNFESYDEATIEAALKLKRRCPGGKVGIKELANLALGRSVHSGFDLDMDLHNAFSGVRFPEFVRKCTQRRLLPAFTEADFAHQKFVQVVDDTYRGTDRHRTYMLGSLDEVPKGGGIKDAAMTADSAYKTNLSRFAKNFTIDECWFEEDGLVSINSIVDAAIAMGRRAPEEKFFALVNAQCAGTVQWDDVAWWEEIWRVWCACRKFDPKDPNNKTSCGTGIPVTTGKLQVLVNDCRMIEARKMFEGTPALCGSAASECAERHLINLFGEFADLCLSPRLKDDGMILLPEANEEAPAFTMSTMNGVVVPSTRVFPMDSKNFGVTVQVKFPFNVQVAEERLIKTAQDVENSITTP